MTVDEETKRQFQADQERAAAERLEGIRQRLRETVKISGLAQGALSEKAGLSRSYIESVVNGRSASPEFSNLQRIASAAGVDVNWLTTGYGTPERGEDHFFVITSILETARSHGFTDAEAHAASGLVYGLAGPQLTEEQSLELLHEVRDGRSRIVRRFGGAIVRDAGTEQALDDLARNQKVR